MARTNTMYLTQPDEEDPLQSFLDGSNSGSGGYVPPEVANPPLMQSPDDRPLGPQLAAPNQAAAAPAERYASLPKLTLRDEYSPLNALIQPVGFGADAAKDSGASSLAAQALTEPKRDPELDAMWRDREKQALNESKAAKPSGVAQLLRDGAGPLAALLVDAVANHGRGATGILGVGLQGAEANRAQDEARAQEAANLALKIRGKEADPYAQALQAERLRIAGLNAGTQATNVGNIQTRADAKKLALEDPNSLLHSTQISQAYRTAEAAKQGNLEAGHAYNATSAEDAGNIRAAQTDAQIGTTLNYAPQTNASAADRAAQEAQARMPTQVALKQTPSPSEQRQIADDAAASQLLPGFHLTDPQAYANARRNPGETAKLDAYMRSGAETIGAMDDLIRLRQQVGRAWNGLDDEQKRVQLGQMAEAQKMAIGGASTMGNTGTLNANEFPRYAKDISDGSLSMSDFSDAVLNKIGFGGSNRDTQLEKMKGVRNQFVSSMNAGLHTIGAGFGEAPANQEGQQPAPQPAPQSDRLPVTTGAVPTVTQAIGGADDNVRVKLGNAIRIVPRALALKARQENPLMEILP
jgi:hypothetical protein